jgi:predicted acylesterase/phospholipase RssA
MSVGNAAVNGVTSGAGRSVLECDLILKGGVTSGVLYPPAVLRLAGAFRFRSIGGASAGAIGAALAAAAEFGRQAFPDHERPPGAGLEGLAELCEELSRPGFTMARLKPLDGFRSLVQALFLFNRLSTSRTAKKSGFVHALRTLLAATVALLAVAPLASLLGGVLFGLLGTPLAREAERTVPALFVPVVLLSSAIGVIVAAGAAMLLRLGGLAPSGAAGYGMCTGSAGARADFRNPVELELTDWLHYWINRLAGKKPGAAPLTFSELERHGIKLRLMSTNLSLSQAFVLPLERGSRSFFFRSEDMKRIFPPAVHAALDAFGRRNPTDKLIFPEGVEFLRFPFGDELPIVVGARLSLSFPVLLTSVRVHSFAPRSYDKARRNEPVDPETDLEDHWFSDGGITSNFPIHLFDTWFPTRPTFGITLYDSPVSRVLAQRESNQTREAVVLPRPRDFDLARPPRTAISGTGDFLRAVFNAAQSHRDVAQSGLPSYRERIVQVFLDSSEGGLNLAMDRKTILGIQHKGTLAADELLARFRSGSALSGHYREHVWVRTLTLLSQLEKHFAEIRKSVPGASWKDEVLADYAALLDEQMNARPVWYRKQSARWNAEALRRVRALLELVDAWDSSESPCFSAEPPRPEGRLRVTSET